MPMKRSWKSGRTEAAGEILEEEYAAGEASFLSLVELLSEERSDPAG